MAEQALRYEKVMTSRLMPQERLRQGLHHADVATRYDDVVNGLVVELNAYVQTQTAGEPAEDHVVVLLPLRPKWIPQFLWKRIPTRRAIFQLRAQPLWAYPDSTYIAPLGAATPMVKVQRDYDSTRWR